jgi:UDP-glucose 4-epimerase
VVLLRQGGRAGGGRAGGGHKGRGRRFSPGRNADVRFGTRHPRKDLEQNTIATYNVLEAVRATGVKKLAFSSTGSSTGRPA